MDFSPLIDTPKFDKAANIRYGASSAGYLNKLNTLTDMGDEIARTAATAQSNGLIDFHTQRKTFSPAQSATLFQRHTDLRKKYLADRKTYAGLAKDLGAARDAEDLDPGHDLHAHTYEEAAIQELDGSLERYLSSRSNSRGKLAMSPHLRTVVVKHIGEENDALKAERGALQGRLAEIRQEKLHRKNVLSWVSPVQRLQVRKLENPSLVNPDGQLGADGPKKTETLADVLSLDHLAAAAQPEAVLPNLRAQTDLLEAALTDVAQNTGPQRDGEAQESFVDRGVRAESADEALSALRTTKTRLEKASSELTAIKALDAVRPDDGKLVRGFDQRGLEELHEETISSGNYELKQAYLNKLAQFLDAQDDHAAAVDLGKASLSESRDKNLETLRKSPSAKLKALEVRSRIIRRLQLYMASRLKSAAASTQTGPLVLSHLQAESKIVESAAKNLQDKGIVAAGPLLPIAGNTRVAGPSPSLAVSSTRSLEAPNPSESLTRPVTHNEVEKRNAVIATVAVLVAMGVSALLITGIVLHYKNRARRRRIQEASIRRRLIAAQTTPVAVAAPAALAAPAFAGQPTMTAASAPAPQMLPQAMYVPPSYPPTSSVRMPTYPTATGPSPVSAQYANSLGLNNTGYNVMQPYNPALAPLANLLSPS